MKLDHATALAWGGAPARGRARPDVQVVEFRDHAMTALDFYEAKEDKRQRSVFTKSAGPPRTRADARNKFKHYLLAGSPGSL